MKNGLKISHKCIESLKTWLKLDFGSPKNDTTFTFERTVFIKLLTSSNSGHLPPLFVVI